jgi:hypothetical protein
MSALPHFKVHGSSVERLSNAVDAINDEWAMFQYLVSIRNLEIEGRDLLEKEARKPRTVNGVSWKARSGSALNTKLMEATAENAPKDSLCRRARIEGNSIKPALIIGLICITRDNGTLKAKPKNLKSKQALEEEDEDAAEEEIVEDVNRDNGKLKSKLTLEEELKAWPTVFFNVLVKRLNKIKAPNKIDIWTKFTDENMRNAKTGRFDRPYSLI